MTTLFVTEKHVLYLRLQAGFRRISPFLRHCIRWQDNRVYRLFFYKIDEVKFKCYDSKNKSKRQ